MALMKLVLSKNGRILLTVYNYDESERDRLYKERCSELKKLIASETDEIKLAMYNDELSRCKAGPSFPYALNREDLEELYAPITQTEPGKLQLLESVRLKNSDDEFERSLLDTYLLGDNATLDIYLIENNSGKKYDPL